LFVRKYEMAGIFPGDRVVKNDRTPSVGSCNENKDDINKRKLIKSDMWLLF